MPKPDDGRPGDRSGNPGAAFTAGPWLDRLLPRPLAPLVTRVADRLAGLTEMRREYARLRARHGRGDHAGFIEAAIDTLRLNVSVTDADVARIPATGPLVVVANHPFGGIEGIVVASMVQRVRKDYRILANELLFAFEELRPALIAVDVFDPKAGARKNVGAVLEAIRHLQAGGCLIIFPAGVVSHFSPRASRVTDAAWQPGTELIIRKGGAAVLPVYVPGHNGLLFNLAGMLHGALRTALLPRALLARRGASVALRVGSIVPARKVADVPAGLLNAELRRRVYLLRHRPDKGGAGVRPSIGPAEAVVPPVPTEALLGDLAALSPEALHAESGDLATYVATAAQIPNILREIGRLREVTFRAVGEGTQREIDLDRFDQDYLHVFVFDRAKSAIVGSYRLGQVDLIVPRLGIAGLYSTSLFRYPERLLSQMGCALEMGRSFVRAEYQRGHQPLLMLWRGIGEVVARSPRYHVLFGPVSISGAYATVSRELMVRFLSMTRMRAAGAELVRPRAPFKSQELGDDGEGGDLVSALLGSAEPAGPGAIGALGEWVSHLEADGKGIPVLLAQYVKWGARALAFNVDNDFGGCLDALVTIDLRGTDRKLLARYMGEEGLRRFAAFHGLDD